MDTLTQTRQQHESLWQLTALGPQMTARDGTDKAIVHHDTAAGEHCQVCGYRAVQRDELLTQEVVVMFSVMFFGCDNPDNYPSTYDSEPVGVGDRQSPYTPVTSGESSDVWDLLRAKATGVLNTHTNQTGLCAVCGGPWPCQLAIVAEHNLAFL